MTNNQFRALVNKYAILIFIGYAMTSVLSIIIHRMSFGVGSDTLILTDLLSSSTWIIQLIVNSIAAILVAKDLKRLAIKNNLIVGITVLFSLIGITMFFITANRELKNSNS